MRVEIEDGKYTYQSHPDGRSEVLRYGEPWRDVVGDKFIYCMAAEIEQLRQRVAELENERDKLRAAAEAIEIDAEECLDFDECTAMLVPLDTYHKLIEAITSVKEKPSVQD